MDYSLIRKKGVRATQRIKQERRKTSQWDTEFERYNKHEPEYAFIIHKPLWSLDKNRQHLVQSLFHFGHRSLSLRHPSFIEIKSESFFGLGSFEQFVLKNQFNNPYLVILLRHYVLRHLRGI